MSKKQSFPPVANKQARIFILGSMPGEKSLQAQQYYAHPQNLFWAFMQELVGIDRQLPYTKRLQGLRRNHIALWDVLQSCERQGSLDQHIRNETANDFDSFFKQHRQIVRIGFNGRKAEQAFTRHVARTQPDWLNNVDLILLPSTSPANASQSRAIKKASWRKFLKD